jgi:short subunit dehydrogenase-like uncharacterized protein
MLFFYGAYGFTGRQIFDFFRSHFPLQSKKIIISGKNKEKLDYLKQKLKNEFPQLEVDILPATPFELQAKKIDGVKLVVNTAGPFSDTGEFVLNFAIRNDANYIDCTGEWNWTKKIIDNYDKILKERKLFASSGVAWETVSGEICVKELVDKLKQEGKISNVKKIHLVYLADFAMSRGTLKSSLKILKSGAIRWKHGKIKTVQPAERKFSFDLQGKSKFLALNLSTSDVINVPLSLGELSQSIEFEVFFATSQRRAQLFSYVIKTIRRLAYFRFFTTISNFILNLLPEPDENRLQNRASAIAFAYDKNSNIISSFEIKATKPYYITAKILAFACSQFEKGNYKKLYGYVSPTSLFDFPKDFIFS